MFGADGPRPIWRDAMNQALRGAPRLPLPMAFVPDPAPPKPEPGNPTETATAPPATTAPGPQR
ncbi:hypothetical protein [Kitasatospora sp. A2-31]|uniref:hypothetical protein n=1 Tax=Kitasatospora sp. A2-31 TaxID=2916414 RepID=UPI001EEB1BA0|nr:hypothetical protein [Kitasatospora sp. A2-31]MCG6494121.1 hypothetical protein [Kitasatospora sp. A2-31]